MLLFESFSRQRWLIVFQKSLSDKTPQASRTISVFCVILISKVKLAAVVEGDQKAPFSISTTPKCWGGRDSIAWIAPFYSWYVPYIAEF